MLLVLIMVHMVSEVKLRHYLIVILTVNLGIVLTLDVQNKLVMVERMIMILVLQLVESKTYVSHMSVYLT